MGWQRATAFYMWKQKTDNIVLHDSSNLNTHFTPIIKLKHKIIAAKSKHTKIWKIIIVHRGSFKSYVCMCNKT